LARGGGKKPKGFQPGSSKGAFNPDGTRKHGRNKRQRGATAYFVGRVNGRAIYKGPFGLVYKNGSPAKLSNKQTQDLLGKD